MQARSGSPHMAGTDSLARLGRAVAVTLVATTQRPDTKGHGQGAVRSQMDVRICFRLRERACLLTDRTVCITVEYFAAQRPELDHVSRNAVQTAAFQLTLEPASRYDSSRGICDRGSPRRPDQP